MSSTSAGGTEDGGGGKVTRTHRRTVVKKDTEADVSARIAAEKAKAEAEEPVKMDYHYTWWNVNTKMKVNKGGVRGEEEEELTAPPRRSGHAAFMLGATDNKIFIHGGAAEGVYYNDLWALDLRNKKWQRIHTYHAPSKRAYHQICVIGPNRAYVGQPSKAIPRLVLFGGFMNGTLFNEVEMLPEFSVIMKGLPKTIFGREAKRTNEPPTDDQTVDVWRRVATVGEVPMPRCNHTVSVIVGKIIVLIGGWHGAFTSDVYTLDTDTWKWTHRRPTKDPSVKNYDFSPRAGHTATVIPGRKILVFGGQNTEQGQLADMWVLDTVSWVWIKPVPLGTSPARRSGHSALYNRDGHVYFFGGWDGIRMRNDLAVLAVSGDPLTDWKWKQPSVKGVEILPRVSCSLVMAEGMLWVYGGWYEGRFLNDVAALEITATPRDMEKDREMKARLKSGIKRMGGALDMAAMERARSRGIDPLAVMDPSKMTADQVEEYHQNVDSKLAEAAQFIRAKGQEIHFYRDRKEKMAKKERALATAHEHQLKFRGFLDQGATTEEAVALAGGFASQQLQARFGVGGYTINPDPPDHPRRQDLTQEQLDERLYGRGVVLGRGNAAGAAGDDILDAIVRQGGLTLTWGEGSNKLPADLWGTDEGADQLADGAGWSISAPGQDAEREAAARANMLTATNLEAIRSGRSRGAASSAAALMSVGSYADDNDSLSEFMSLSSGSFSPTGIREPPGIEIPVYDGVLPVTRKGDDNIPGMHPNMGPVLREVLRDQAKSKPFKRGDLKIPPPARHAARPTRIVGGMNLPASLDDIIDPRRIQDRPRESLYLPEPYHPDKTWVPQDLDDVVLQGEAFKESNLAASARGDELALVASEGMAQLSVADTGGKPQHHLLALATMTPGVTEARVVQAARGGPLPIPGVPYGEDPARPVPYAMEKVVHGMQKVAKGWMQKKEYKRQRAAGKIQAFVRGRWDRMRVAKMRAEMGLPPLGAKYVRRTARNKKRYEDKRTRDLRTAYHRQVAGIVPAMELEKATEQPRYSAGGKTPTRNPY